jgi:hypothetical protein
MSSSGNVFMSSLVPAPSIKIIVRNCAGVRENTRVSSGADTSVSLSYHHDESYVQGLVLMSVIVTVSCEVETYPKAGGVFLMPLRIMWEGPADVEAAARTIYELLKLVTSSNEVEEKMAELLTKAQQRVDHEKAL